MDYSERRFGFCVFCEERHAPEHDCSAKRAWMAAHPLNELHRHVAELQGMTDCLASPFHQLPGRRAMVLWLFDHLAYWSERVGDRPSAPFFRLRRWAAERWWEHQP